MITYYKTNLSGLERNKSVSKDFIKGLIIEPLIYTVIIILVYFSIWTKSHLYFYFMLAMIILWIAFGWYATIRLVKRQSKTIIGIDFSNDEVTLKLDKILWIKAMEYRLSKLEIRLKDRKFGWYGKRTEREGISIFTNEIEFFLVKDYFDDYNDILKQFNK